MAYEDIPPFHIADYVVFGLSIAISLGIGIYQAFARGQQRTTAEYLVGSRKMKVLPVTMSLIVSFESSIMMLGFPAETYLYGFTYSFIALGWLVSAMIATFVFVPMLHAVKLTSVFEYVERRYNSTYVRLLGNILQTVNTLMYMGVVLFGPAIALEAVAGFPIYGSIIVIAVVAVAYTSVGGIKAVVWTDFFQCGVMIIGILAVLIKGSMAVGGVGEVFRLNRESGRLNVSFDPTPTKRLTFWTIGVLSIFRFLGLCFNQASFQRISTQPTIKAAKTVFFLSGPGFFIFCFLACVEGLVMFAYFEKQGCDPLKAGRIKNPNQLIILLVLELFQEYPGMAGLFLAALFSASLSTLSSGMGSVSANFWEDIVKPRIGPITEAKATLIAKVSVVGCGVISILVSMAVAEVGGSLAEIGNVILGAAGAPLAGLYLAAALLPSVHARGIFIAAIFSFVFTVWISLGRIASKDYLPNEEAPPASMHMCSRYSNMSVVTNFTIGNYSLAEPEPMANGMSHDVNPLYTISPYSYSAFGLAVTLVIAVISSHILGHKESDKMEASLVSHIITKIWCCESFRKRFISNKPAHNYRELDPVVVITHNGVIISQVPGGERTIELPVIPGPTEKEGTTGREIIVHNNPDHVADNSFAEGQQNHI